MDCAGLKKKKKTLRLRLTLWSPCAIVTSMKQKTELEKYLLSILPLIRSAVDAWEALPREIVNSQELDKLGINLEQLRSAHYQFTELNEKTDAFK